MLLTVTCAALLLMLANVNETAKPFRKTADMPATNAAHDSIMVADAGRPVAYEHQQFDERAPNGDMMREMEVNGMRLHPSAVNKFRQLMQTVDDRKARYKALREWLESTARISSDE